MNEPPPAAPASPGRLRPLRWLLRALALSLPLVLIGLLIYGVVAQNPNTAIDDSLARGQAPNAPPFRLAVLQVGSLGSELEPKLASVFRQRFVTLTHLRGTPVVLNIWASWCVPCQQEAPTLERAWRQQARPDRVIFIGLDMQDATTDSQTFMRHYRIDYPNIRDPSNDVARSYGATGVPETFFISAQGRIVGHIIGVSSTAQLTAGIAAARRGRVQEARHGGQQRSFQ
ncbi:MAG: TlpA family protein disulfide reductase [Actinomycetota bacterium]|nr:TlpA family protein disulfide reductase [Actinomycetota bacterium]